MFWSRPDVRVLFVCTANICRSPLAEALLRQRLRRMSLAGRVEVRSAGTSAVPARRPDPRVRRLAEEAGVALGRTRSRPLTREMIRRSDLVLVMPGAMLPRRTRRIAIPTTQAARSACGCWAISCPRPRGKVEKAGKEAGTW